MDESKRQPFQFTLARLLSSMTLLAAGLVLFFRAQDITRNRYPEILPPDFLLINVSALAAFGAGIGFLFKKPFRGAAISVGLGLLFFCVLASQSL